ncbi:unnamed protein product, partial [Staurois parvus]
YPHRHSWPWLSITGSWRVITRRCPVLTENLRQGGGLLCLPTVLLPVGVRNLGVTRKVWTDTNTPPPSKTLPAHS